MAPLDEKLPPQKRMETVIELSDLVMRIATHVICHTLVDYQEQLKEERLSIAHAFLQRVTTTHLCNHKLTAEGLVFEYKGQPFELHEEYKTMMLTRSVYEHLVMFYFLFEHPKNDEERHLVWKYWQINGKSVEAFKDEDGKYSVRTLSYSQAWKYLFSNGEMASFYRHLSMHCHPVYQGLMQYQDQALSDQGNDGIPLYFSCRFLACLCSMFLKQIPDGNDIIRKEFSEQEQSVFSALLQLPKER
jgi:hypothetical protein